MLVAVVTGSRRRGRGRPQQDRVGVGLERRFLDNGVVHGGAARCVFVQKQLPGIHGDFIVHFDGTTQDEKTVDETVDLDRIHAAGSATAASIPVDHSEMRENGLDFRVCSAHYV